MFIIISQIFHKYVWYMNMKVNVIEQKHVKSLNELAGIKKNIKIQRAFKREGFDFKKHNT